MDLDSTVKYRYTVEKKFSTIGLITRGEDFEYPLWALWFSREGKYPYVTHVNVHNSSAYASQEKKHPPICALVVMAPAEGSPETIHVEGEGVYYRTWESKGLIYKGVMGLYFPLSE